MTEDEKKLRFAEVMFELAKAHGRIEALEWVIERCVSIGMRSVLVGDTATRDKFAKFAGHMVKRVAQERETLKAQEIALLSDGTVN